MYKPMLFIFLVVVAPGITDAMFYYESNVLGFTSTDFAVLLVISSCASIVGVCSYRVLFVHAKLKWYFLFVTLLLSGSLLANLMIISPHWRGYRVALAQQLVYGLLNELHLMPLMIIAC